LSKYPKFLTTSVV